MKPRAAADIPSMEGSVAYPRKNGEPVFEAPWQSRAFGMVVDLHTKGVYPWDDFKERLIEQVAEGDRTASCAAAPAPESKYYDQWVDAFTRLLVETKLVSADELAQRIEDFRNGTRQQVY